MLRAWKTFVKLTDTLGRLVMLVAAFYCFGAGAAILLGYYVPGGVEDLQTYGISALFIGGTVLIWYALGRILDLLAEIRDRLGSSS